MVSLLYLSAARWQSIRVIIACYTNGEISHVSDFQQPRGSELNDGEHCEAFLVVLGLSSR